MKYGTGGSRVGLDRGKRAILVVTSQFDGQRRAFCVRAFYENDSYKMGRA